MANPPHPEDTGDTGHAPLPLVTPFPLTHMVLRLLPGQESRPQLCSLLRQVLCRRAATGWPSPGPHGPRSAWPGSCSGSVPLAPQAD